MRPISPSMNCQHQANTAYDKLAVISENIPKLLEIEQFIFELKQWLRAYIGKVKESIDAEHHAKLAENNIFTGINTFADVYLNNGNIYWKDEYNKDLAWIKYDKEHQILTLHVKDSELSLSPNLAITVPTNAEVDNSIVTYAFLHGLLQELEERVTITKDTTITEGSTNIPITDAVYQFVIANKPTFDDTVTQNSSNGVKSSGIYAALQELQSQIDALTEELSESRGDLFDILNVEHGLYTKTEHTKYNSQNITFLAGHLYRVTSNLREIGSPSGTTYQPASLRLSSTNLQAVRILTYPDLTVYTVFKPLEDISTTPGGSNTTCVYNEFTLIDVATDEKPTTISDIVGVGVIL